MNDLELKIEIIIPKIFEVSENNLNEVCSEFYSLFTSAIDAHGPLTKLSQKQKRLKNKPWITKGLLTSIKKKQAMHRTHYVNGSRVAQLVYETYCNVLTKPKTIAKKLYYHQKLGEYHNNSKKRGIFCGTCSSRHCCGTGKGLCWRTR